MELRKVRADIAGSTVAVVRGGGHDDGNTGGTVALVGDFLEVIALRPLRLLDGALDIVIRDVVRFRLLNQIAQLAV